MSRRPRLCAIPLLLVAWLGVARADDRPAPSRVMTGQVQSTDGRPVTQGRVFFRVDQQGLEYLEAWSAPLDAEGRFRVGLADATQRNRANGEMVVARANGPLVSEVVAPGYRGAVGKVVAVEVGGRPDEPITVRLTPEAWRSKELLVVDHEGRPVAGAAVTLSIATSREWARAATDAVGQCRVETPPNRFCGVEVRAPGSVVSTTALSGTAAEPARITLPVRPPIRGRVVGADGAPVAGLAIGRLLVADEEEKGPVVLPLRYQVFPFLGANHISEAKPRATDAEGRFELDFPLALESRQLAGGGKFSLFAQGVCFADAEGRPRALLIVDRDHQRDSYEVALRPLRTVRVPIEHEVTLPSGRLQTWWGLYARIDGEGKKLAYVMSGPAVGDGAATDRVEVDLPPGQYQLEINSADPKTERGMEEATVSLTVPEGDGPVTLPGVRLPQLLQKRLVGQPAPEIDARAIDTGAPVRLADQKGRVVVLDFWGYWCGPCLGALPELIRVHDEFRAKPVSIIALHDSSIQDRKAFDDRLANARRTSWSDRDLPFLVAFDRPAPDLPADESGIGRGVSCGRYEVSAFPTTLVIDQSGRVVGNFDARDRDSLVAKIHELLAQPPR